MNYVHDFQNWLSESESEPTLKISDFKVGDLVTFNVFGNPSGWQVVEIRANKNAVVLKATNNYAKSFLGPHPEQLSIDQLIKWGAEIVDKIPRKTYQRGPWAGRNTDYWNNIQMMTRR